MNTNFFTPVGLKDLTQLMTKGAPGALSHSPRKNTQPADNQYCFTVLEHFILLELITSEAGWLISLMQVSLILLDEDVQLYRNEYNNIPVGEVTGENNMHSRPARTAGLHGTLVRFVEPDHADSISLLHSVFGHFFVSRVVYCTIFFPFVYPWMIEVINNCCG